MTDDRACRMRGMFSMGTSIPDSSREGSSDDSAPACVATS